jgi:hypothetical protein
MLYQCREENRLLPLDASKGIDAPIRGQVQEANHGKFGQSVQKKASQAWRRRQRAFDLGADAKVSSARQIGARRHDLVQNRSQHRAPSFIQYRLSSRVPRAATAHARPRVRWM